MKIFKARADNPRKYIVYTMNRRFPVTISNPAFACAENEKDLESEVRWIVYQEIKREGLLNEVCSLR